MVSAPLAPGSSLDDHPIQALKGAGIFQINRFNRSMAHYVPVYELCETNI